MRAGFDNNPALQNLQHLILGLTDLTFNFPCHNKRTLNNVSRHTGILIYKQNIERSLSEVDFDQRQSALKQK